MSCTTTFLDAANSISPESPKDMPLYPDISFGEAVCAGAIYSIPLYDRGANEPVLLAFPGGQYGIWKRFDRNFSVAELFAFEFAGGIGMPELVPETVVFEQQPGVGTVQRHIDAPVAMEVDEKRCQMLMKSEAGLHLAIFDYLIAQTDRNAANWLVDDGGKLTAIDNGNAFLNERTNSPFYRLHQGKPIPPEILTALGQIKEADIRRNFALMRSQGFQKPPDYYAELMWRRIRKCVESGQLPKTEVEN